MFARLPSAVDRAASDEYNQNHYYDRLATLAFLSQVAKVLSLLNFRHFRLLLGRVHLDYRMD